MTSSAAALGVVPAACSASPRGQTTAPDPPATIELSVNDSTSFSDGAAHYIVRTRAASTAPAAELQPSPSAPLTAVTPADAAERDAVTAAGGGALVVLDGEGIVGPPGGRYLQVGSVLTPLDVSTGAEADADIARSIAAVNGVRSAEVVGPGVVAVVAGPDAATVRDAVAAVEGVESVAEDVVFSYSDDARQGDQWAISNTGSASQANGSAGVAGADTAAPAAWTVSRGAGIVVAVIDSGVERTHPDLAGQLWVNAREVCDNGVDDDANGFADDCNGWDFGSGDKNPNPDPNAVSAGHGTHVAGIIAAAVNGTGTVGVAPGAHIMALKVGDTTGQMTGAAIVAAVNYAAANGANVINMSLGTSPGIPRSSMGWMESAVANATARGITVVVAAGNNGIDITNNPVWPANLSLYNPGVITVGASTNSDTRASFSNSGSPVNIMAPGWYVLSTYLNASWTLMSGTSMASPYVAGGAAVVIASGLATAPSSVRERLVATTDQTLAGGRMNLATAVGTDRSAATGQNQSVVFTGVDALRADADAAIGITVRAGAKTGVSQMRLLVAARDGDTLAVVEGLAVTITDSSGTLGTLASGEDGAFPVVPLGDTAALGGAGTLLTAGLNLPPGDYAFVAELLDSAGTAVGQAHVVYLSVPTPVATTVPETTDAPPAATPPATTAPPVTTTAPPTSSAVTTAPPTSPSVSAPASQPPSSQPPAGFVTPPPTSSASSAPPTSTPATTTPPASPPQPGTTAPTTVPATTSPPATSPPTTGSPVSTISATSSPATTTPATTSPATAPATTAPATTTPAPARDTDGTYRVDSMTPRLAPICGGVSAVIDGKFPTNVPVYVWFGADGPVVPADVSPTRLTLTVPAVQSERTVDVIVRFTTSRPYSLVLASAFTLAGTTGCGASSPGSTAPATTAPTTTTATTAPATTAPVPTAPVTTSPVTTSPATTAPATTVAPGTVIGSRGRLTLRSRPASGPLASLSVSAWPSSGCRQASCPAIRL